MQCHSNAYGARIGCCVDDAAAAGKIRKMVLDPKLFTNVCVRIDLVEHERLGRQADHRGGGNDDQQHYGVIHKV